MSDPEIARERRNDFEGERGGFTPPSEHPPALSLNFGVRRDVRADAGAAELIEQVSVASETFR